MTHLLSDALHILVNQEIRTISRTRGLPRNRFFADDESQKIRHDNRSKIAFAEGGLQIIWLRCMLIILVRFGDAGEWPCQNNARMSVWVRSHTQWTPRITWCWLLLLQNVITTTRTTSVVAQTWCVYSSLARAYTTIRWCTPATLVLVQWAEQNAAPVQPFDSTTPPGTAAKPIRARIAICITLFGSFEHSTAQKINLIRNRYINKVQITIRLWSIF